MSRPSPPQPIEIAIGPHGARVDWRVLRVSYLPNGETSVRINAALTILLAEPAAAPAAGDP